MQAVDSVHVTSFWPSKTECISPLALRVLMDNQDCLRIVGESSMSTTPCIRRLKPCHRAYHPRAAVRPQAPAVPQDDALSFFNACFQHILYRRRCRVCAVRRRIPHHRRVYDVLHRTSRLRARVPHKSYWVPLNLRSCKLSSRLVDVAPTGRAHTLCYTHLTLFTVHLLCLMPFSRLSYADLLYAVPSRLCYE